MSKPGRTRTKKNPNEEMFFKFFDAHTTPRTRRRSAGKAASSRRTPNLSVLFSLRLTHMRMAGRRRISGGGPPTPSLASIRALYFFFLIVCLNFRTAKFNSMDVSLSLAYPLSSRIPEINSPPLFIRDFCSASS